MQYLIIYSPSTCNSPAQFSLLCWTRNKTFCFFVQTVDGNLFGYQNYSECLFVFQQKKETNAGLKQVNKILNEIIQDVDVFFPSVEH